MAKGLCYAQKLCKDRNKITDLCKVFHDILQVLLSLKMCKIGLKLNKRANTCDQRWARKIHEAFLDLDKNRVRDMKNSLMLTVCRDWEVKIIPSGQFFLVMSRTISTSDFCQKMRLRQFVGGSTCSLLRFYWRENIFNKPKQPSFYLG